MKSTMGRGLALAWFLVVLIFTSSYTASLSSIILARQRRIPTIRSFLELQKGHGPIGCQEGSFTVNYFNSNLDISPDRLVNLVSVDDYYNSLNGGSVAAIVDESPYIDVFLSNSSNCKDLKMVDSNIAYFGGLAFVRRTFVHSNHLNLMGDFAE
jgi:ionotropic glutamate receptor